MQCATSRVLCFVLVCGSALAAVSCSKDDIPTTPSAPFLLTEVAVSKFVSPPPTDTLHPGQTYLARVSTSYTLSDSDAARINTLEVLPVINSYDINGSFVQVIANVAYTPPVLQAPSGVQADSISFTVPTTGVFFIAVGAGVVQRFGTITNGGAIGPYWTVK